MRPKKIVVCGATGSQGGAVVDSLLRQGGYKVLAFSRQISGPASQALQKRGVEVVEGDLLDGHFLQHLFSEVDGVFGVTQPWSADYKTCDVEAELKQGRNIIDACRANQVPHLVLSSVINLTGQPTGMPHADSKLELESYCRHSSVPYTILQLASFLDNIGKTFFPIQSFTIRGFVDRDAKVGYIACRDIGEIAARAFQQPERYQGRAVRLIADLISGADLVECLRHLTGRHRWYWAPPHWMMWLLAHEFALMRQVMEEYGRPPKIQLAEEMVAECRAEFPDLWTLEDYLRAQGYGQQA